jgi:ribosome-associated protein YbcJ (S4-like RNA binding protein)
VKLVGSGCRLEWGQVIQIAEFQYFQFNRRHHLLHILAERARSKRVLGGGQAKSWVVDGGWLMVATEGQ